jgi:hypothetical protein
MAGSMVPDLSSREYESMFELDAAPVIEAPEDDDGGEEGLEDEKATPCPLARAKMRRVLSHMYERMGCPPEWSPSSGINQWKGRGGIISLLKKDLGIAWKTVYVHSVLERTREHFVKGTLHKFDAGAVNGGEKTTRKRKLGNVEMQLALKSCRDSLGLVAALRRVNDYRRIHLQKPGVSFETLRSSLTHWGAVCHLRQTRKTGNRDPFSCWAVFRHQFARQLQHQCHPDFELRDQVEGWNKIKRHAIFFTDEHHEKCRIGVCPPSLPLRPSAFFSAIIRCCACNSRKVLCNFTLPFFLPFLYYFSFLPSF